jgi:hypothetical protein
MLVIGYTRTAGSLPVRGNLELLIHDNVQAISPEASV